MTRQKLLLRSAICLCLAGLPSLAGPALGQEVLPPGQVVYQPLSDDQIDSLTARVALYPDAVLSDVFVGSTYPLQVVEASQWLAAGNDPAAVDSQGWDSSVKALVRVPPVLNKMSADVAWMNDLGLAFLNQREQVFASVQRLRADAIAAGTLYSTPQQEVLRDNGIIEIFPADPQVIYVPTYDPDVVYRVQDAPAVQVVPFESFQYSYPVGIWLCYDVDWDDHDCYYGNWGASRPWWHWHDHPEWHYRDGRPGRFVDAGHDDRHDHEDHDVASNRWTHDQHVPGPEFHHLPPQQPPIQHLSQKQLETVSNPDRGPEPVRNERHTGTERNQPEHHDAPAPAETPKRRESSSVQEPPVHQAPAEREQPRQTAPKTSNDDRGGDANHGRSDDTPHDSKQGNADRSNGDDGKSSHRNTDGQNSGGNSQNSSNHQRSDSGNGGNSSSERNGNGGSKSGGSNGGGGSGNSNTNSNSDTSGNANGNSNGSTGGTNGGHGLH